MLYFSPGDKESTLRSISPANIPGFMTSSWRVLSWLNGNSYLTSNNTATTLSNSTAAITTGTDHQHSHIMHSYTCFRSKALTVTAVLLLYRLSHLFRGLEVLQKTWPSSTKLTSSFLTHQLVIELDPRWIIVQMCRAYSENYFLHRFSWECSSEPLEPPLGMGLATPW